MAPDFTDILDSKIYRFTIGDNGKEYSIHGGAIARLSKSLDILMNGPHKEAQELHIDWPDIDEDTFVRLVAWAYAETYTTENPVIVIGQGDVPSFENVVQAEEESSVSQDGVASATEVAETAPPSLRHLHAQAGCPSTADVFDPRCCHNPVCSNNKRIYNEKLGSVLCLICRELYQSEQCGECASAFSHCPRCIDYHLTDSSRAACANQSCKAHGCANSKRQIRSGGTSASLECPRCLQIFGSSVCYDCNSAYHNCPRCTGSLTKTRISPRARLIARFLDDDGAEYPPSVPAFMPRQNTEPCEDYSGVFMCHAKLYVIGDKYSIPELCRVSLHRLHATLSCFLLFPSRCDDVAIMAKYLLANTRADDKIREMIALFYACQAEHVCDNDAFHSLMYEVPDFSSELFSCLSERLA